MTTSVIGQKLTAFLLLWNSLLQARRIFKDAGYSETKDAGHSETIDQENSVAHYSCRLFQDARESCKVGDYLTAMRGEFDTTQSLRLQPTTLSTALQIDSKL